MKIQAVADLGGLGAKEGAPVTYNWMLPNLVQPLLAWLVVLGLLLIKPNRCCAAWWILVPLAAVVGGAQAVLSLAGWSSSETDMFTEAITAFTFGLAATWLLAPFLARKHRFVTFLCFLPVMLGFGVLTFALRQDWSEGYSVASMVVLQVGIFLSLGVLVTALAMFLTGCLCRRSYRPVALALWLLAMLVVLWFVIVVPIFTIGMLMSGGDAPWLEMLGGLFIIAGVNFAIVLPFLLLSFFDPLYRERLKGLLHVAMTVPPAPLTEPPPVLSPSV